MLVCLRDGRLALTFRDGDIGDLFGKPTACPSRAMLNASAVFSAVSRIESTPRCFSISGLTKRQPIVVS